MNTQRFGLLDKKKFPMPDRQHVFSAIKFFNYATPSEERRLANAIIARMGDYGISWDDVNVGPTNRFRKYIPKRKQEESISHHGIKGQHWGVKNGPPYPLDRQKDPIQIARERIKEASKTRDAVEDIVKRMSDTDLRMLNQDKGKEYMSVQEGEYLVKRFTKNEKGKPVAFLDLIDGYGDLLNVSVGTDPKHRGKGYAKELTKEAVGWFNNQNDYKILNWSARKENVGSNKVAKESGFKKNYYYSKNDPEWNVYEIKK